MEIDYKKEYEAMVQRARELHETGNELTKRQMEIVCQELRESEDEEIRKHIIDLVKDNAKSKSIPCDAEIAYLEKQKDASKAIEAVERIDKYIDRYLANAHDMDDSNPYKKYYRGWDDALGKMAGILQDVYSEAEQKEQTSDIILKAFENSKTDYSLEEREEASDYSEKVLPTSIACGESDEEFLLHKVIEAAYIAGQKEQKPPIAGNDFGWIDELKHDLEHPEELDEKVQEVLKKRQKPVEYLDKDKVYAIMTKLTNLSYSQLIPINSDEFKKLHEITSDVRDLLDYPIEQKPAEWSEEDEDMLNCCISSIEEAKENRYAYKETDGDTSYDHEIAWLKSLRPSWKPSDEQMSALNYFIKLWGNSDDQLEYTKIFNNVKSLRDDLEKQM